MTLGAYTLKSFDPNGQWHLWERRDDWQRSSTGGMGEPAAKYVFYKNFGDEQTRTLAFIKNQYDVDTFMSPDSIAAAQKQNPLDQDLLQDHALPRHGRCLLVRHHHEPAESPVG